MTTPTWPGVLALSCSYELHVDAVHLLVWYGGTAHLAGEEYYASDLQRGE